MTDTFADADADRFTDWLRDRTGPAWSEATDHRFTRELAADTVDDAVFRRYLLQDYAFLDALVGAFGHAVGQAPTMASKARLVEFLGVLTDEENDYFERSFEALGVPADEYGNPELTETTAAFRDHLAAVARGNGYAETLAVLVPAEWIYLTWAGRVDDPPERFYLREWVGLHANPAFEAFVDWLRSELDRIGPTLSLRRERRVASRFERTVDLEAAFFSAAYDQ